MKRTQLALFGDPVSQSPSPGIHKAFGRQFNLEIEYQLIQAGAGTLQSALEVFHQMGGQGCNITVPLKHEAFGLADVASTRASLAGAANTLWWESEQLHADNTDGPGLVRDIEDNSDFAISGKKLLILGAGGATAGILGSLLNRSPAEIVIANRTPERAQKLASAHTDLGAIRAIPNEQVSSLQGVDLILDATSAGHSGALPSLPEEVLARTRLCYSLNYGLTAEPLGMLCRSLTVNFKDGLGMLVEQAAIAFEIWTGLKPRTEDIRIELESRINRP